MLIFHIYLVIGTTLLNNIQNTEKKREELNKREYELQMFALQGESKSLLIEKGQIEGESVKVEDELRSSHELLKSWLAYQNYFLPDKEETKSNPTAQPQFMMQRGPGQNTTYSTNKDIQEARNLVSILGIYILPLLYGLLGGFAFVLRSLAEETKNMVFSANSTIKYTLRINLGALAGLVVGLLWGEDVEIHDVGFIKSLSTLALAFIAGYSIEFLFAAIDRIIESIGKSKSAASEKAK